MSWDGRHALVTGGAGFVGSHLTEALVKRGARVTVVDNMSTGREEHLRHLARDVTIVRGSTSAPLDLARAMQGVDTVFHLAAVLGVKRTWEEPVRVIQENVEGTLHVLRAAAEAGARHVVLASSSEVYGDGDPPYAEDATPAAPRTGYAAAKLVEEKLAEGFTSETGMTTTALRYFNVYGPRQERSAYGFVASIFCDRVRQGLAPVVFGSGEQTRDFTFVEDTVEGTLLAAERGAGGKHAVLNLGTGVETRIVDLARAIAEAAGKPELRPTFAPPRADEVQRRVADSRRARETLGWEPRVPLSEGLARTLGA
ncbi:MAG: UDP-glucose 4-epimerase [Thermoplasmata archaeon]|nr:UDP-glucose 4-epimerase [Thermoplasmata archaeon]